MLNQNWLALEVTKHCDHFCIGCKNQQDSQAEFMPTPDMAKWLRQGFALGMRGLWVTGGEPTLHSELITLIRFAKRNGYRDILLQTDGWRLASRDYVWSLLRAGVTHVRLNIKSANASLHDRLSGQRGSLSAAYVAIEHCRSAGIDVSSDILLSNSTLGTVSDTIDELASRGVGSFWLWVLRRRGEGNDMAGEIPLLEDVVKTLETTVRVDHHLWMPVYSPNTPPCVFTPQVRAMLQPAWLLQCLVARSDGACVPIESTELWGASQVPSCRECMFGAECPGPRTDFVEQSGDTYFRPVDSSEPR